MLQDDVWSYCSSLELLVPGARVVVAVSGGSDSVALLRLLCSLRESYRLDLVCAHFNHQLRGAESDADEAFVRDLAGSLEVPCETRIRGRRGVRGGTSSQPRRGGAGAAASLSSHDGAHDRSSVHCNGSHPRRPGGDGPVPTVQGDRPPGDGGHRTTDRDVHPSLACSVKGTASGAGCRHRVLRGGKTLPTPMTGMRGTSSVRG